MAIVILPLIIVTSYEYVKIRKPISAVFKTLSRPFKKNGWEQDSPLMDCD